MDSRFDLLTTQHWSRRSILRGGVLGLGGLAAAALVGCGGDEEDVAPAEGSATTTSTAPAAGTGPGRLVQEEGAPFPYQYPDPPGEPKFGGHFTFSTTYDVSIFDPVKSPAGGTIQATNMGYNRLIGFANGVYMDPFKLELKPELAASWERSPDGLSYTFHLTPGVKWQNLDPLNGRDFVAEDVKFAYERYQAGGQGSINFANVASIDASDPATLVITMAKPVADFINPLGGRYITIFPHELADDGSIERRIVGTGPMIMKEAVQARHIKYEQNPDYFRRQVLLDTAEHRIIPDAAARLAAFRAGQTDTGYTVVSSLSETEALLDSNPDVQVQLGAVTSATTTFALNLLLPKYQDPRVRQAISLAIDRPSLISIIFEGLGKALPSLPWPFVFDQEPGEAELGPYMKYDPAGAQRLLSAAGAEGLQINSIYFAYGAYNTRTSEILTDTFREAGITLNDRSVDYTTFNSQWTGSTLEEASTSAWQTLGYDADNFFNIQVRSGSPGNRWRINDPQMDEWAEAQQIELDPQARRAIHRQMWDYEMEQMFRPGLPGGLGFSVLQPWVRGLRSGPISSGSVISYDDGAMIEDVWLDR